MISAINRVDFLRSTYSSSIRHRIGRLTHEILFNHVNEILAEVFHPVVEPMNPAVQVIEKHNGRNRGNQAGGGRDQSFGDAGGHSADTGGTLDADHPERMHDSPNGTEQTDKRCRATRGRQKIQPVPQLFNFMIGGLVQSQADALEIFRSQTQRPSL